MYTGINSWVLGETFEQIGDRFEELGTKVVLLFGIPILGIFEITFRETSNDDVVLHRLRRRSATSLHGDPASGFFWCSSNRRSSSSRCESETGRDAVLASSATVSQIAVTS